MSAGVEASLPGPAAEPGRPDPPPEGGAAEAGGRRDRALRAGGLALLAGAAYAYRELLLMRPGTALSVPLSADVESWFFEPSDSSPGLVLLLVAWLVYRRWGRLRRVLGHPGGWGGALAWMALGAGAFFWAMRTGAYDLLAISLGGVGLGAAHAFGGRAAVRILALPAAMLLFALPLPAPLLNEVVWRLQLWTAEYTGLLLHLLGQPALVSGDQILQPDQVFQIIETCSGMRAIETLTMLSVLMVDLFRRRGLHAALLIAAAPLVGFAVNGFRALGLIFNPHAEIAAIHNAQGIAMLLGGVLVLYALDGGLARVLHSPPPVRGRHASGAAPSLRSRWAGLAALVALLVGMSWLTPWALSPQIARQPAGALPLELDGWRGRDVETDRIFLGLAGFSHILHRAYASGGDRVEAFVATGTLARRERSFLTPKTALPGAGWIVEEQGERELAGQAVDRRVVRRGTRRMLVYHWREGSAGLAGETVRSTLALDGSPFRREEIPVVVRLSAPVPAREGGISAADAALSRFGAALQPALQELGTPRG